MRITRAAKVAAFPLTALILVALVACQGPVGPTGPTGLTGASGPSGPGVIGPTGATGPMGIGVLALVRTTPVYLWVPDDTRGRYGALPAPHDVKPYFRGGKEPITYALVEKSAAADKFTVAIDSMTGIVTVTLTTATDTGADGTTDYEPADDGDMAGSRVTVTATDADKFSTGTGTDVLTIHVLRNKAPVIPDGANPLITTVGSQTGTDAAKTNTECKVFNVCEYTILPGAFEDDIYNSVAGTPAGFFTYTVTNTANASATVKGNKVTITGISPTWNKAKKPAGDDPAIVTITATDLGGMPVMRDLMVTVDGPPAVVQEFEATYTEKLGPLNTSRERVVIIRGVAEFLTDVEDVDDDSATTTFAATSSKPAIASIDTSSTANVQVMLKNIGSTMITVMATDMRGQTTKRSFMLDVKSNLASA